MRRFLFLICCSSLFFVFACSKKGDEVKSDVSAVIPSVEVVAKTDRTKATVSQTILYTLSVKYDPEIKVNLPEAGAKIAGLRITDFGEKGPA